MASKLRPPEDLRFPLHAYPEFVTGFVADWYESWNAHDLDRILRHYADDVVFTSPYIATLGADASGQLVGKARLREYWRSALARFPELHFQPLAVAVGVQSLVLTYHGVGGVLASEMLELGDDGMVNRSWAHYGADRELGQHARAGGAD